MTDRPTDELPADPRSFDVPAPTGVVSPPATPAEPAATPPAQQEPAPTPPARRRRRWPKVIAATLAALVFLTILGFFYAQWAWGRIERVDTPSLADTTGAGTNYLIIGSDSREGVDEDNPNAGVIFGEGDGGTRTDTVVLLHIGEQNAMMAIPRDLLVTNAATGEEGRINAAIQSSPDALIQTVQQTLGVPVHHFMEVDFAGFLELVDAVGGVDIEFEFPAFDEKSGLSIPEPGVHRLDSDEALAYVRSRTYTEVRDGEEIVDGTADLGRVERQQEFLRSLFGSMGSTRNPLKLNRMMLALTDHMTVDESMSFWDAFGLARKLGGLTPETLVLPTSAHRTGGGASVLLLQESAAQPVLDRFR